MVHVDVSEHYPIGDIAPEDKRVLFVLLSPLGVLRVVAKPRLYTQRLWLLGKSGRIAVEGAPTGTVNEAMVMMSLTTFASLTTQIMDARPDLRAEWLARHERDA